MPEAFASAVVPASVDEVWRVVRDFGGLSTWHPAIETSQLVGDVRTDQVGAVRWLALAGDGGEVTEALATLDDHDRQLTYAILTSPFPVVGYRSTIRVTPLTTTDQAFVAWTVTFDCDLADSERLSRFFSQDVFASGLEGLTGFLSRS